MALRYVFEDLEPIQGQLVRFEYRTVVGKESKDSSVAQREGTNPNEVVGHVLSIRKSTKGKILVNVRNMNLITKGNRKEISDQQVRTNAKSELVYKGAPGEYVPRTYREEGIRKLEACIGGKWKSIPRRRV